MTAERRAAGSTCSNMMSTDADDIPYISLDTPPPSPTAQIQLQDSTPAVPSSDEDDEENEDDDDDTEDEPAAPRRGTRAQRTGRSPPRVDQSAVEKPWTDTGCCYGLPKIRERPYYPKLKHDVNIDAGGKRGANC
ncbi:hypothetical protein R3P38DRAFT_3213839 [Favolaschia claudopus]|uniref:Uncharacterized protein n=1 Tax=Favolaschia claudopus TaxID=2862362 RepID=A0AAW0ACC4_9AGAR